MNEKKYIFERYPRLTLLIISLVLILIIDFISGLLFIPDNYDEFRTKHYYYHHTLTPDYSGTGAWGYIYYPMHTNSLGFRDKENRTIPLKASKKRILFLGDSQTEAVGMKYEDSFVGIVAEKFAKQNIEVLNASAVSYSPKLFYLKTKFIIENIGLEFDTLIVTLDISDMQNEIVYQDYEPNNKTSINKLKYNFNRFFKQFSFIYYSIKEFAKTSKQKEFVKQAKLFTNNKAKHSENIVELYATFFSDFDEEQLISNPSFHGVGRWMYDSSLVNLAEEGTKTGMQHMEKLAALCKKNNIDLIISVHPWQPQVRKGNQTDYFVESWRSFAKKHQAGFINLYPVFINQRNPEAVVNEFFIKNDNHWNEAGNKAAAKRLYQILNEEDDE